MNVHLTPTEVLAGLGGLVALVTVWRVSVRAARRAAETARASVRVVSLAGRVGVTAAVIVVVQWVRGHASGQRDLGAVGRAGPAGTAGRAHAHPCVDGDHGSTRRVGGAVGDEHGWTGWAAHAAHPPRSTGHPSHEVSRQVDRLCWTGILMGLAFTMSNVQGFAAAGARVWSVPWWAAWLLDPMVSLVLLAILRAEQVTARCGVRPAGGCVARSGSRSRPRIVMNTWAAFTTGSPALVVLHSVPPLVVFVAAEARHRTAEQVRRSRRAGHEASRHGEPLSASNARHPRVERPLTTTSTVPARRGSRTPQ